MDSVSQINPHFLLNSLQTIYALSLEKSDHTPNVILQFSSILFIEGLGDYIRINLEDKNLVVHDTMKNIMASLPDAGFMRIHKSYVLNLKKIAFMEGNQIRIGDQNIPVSSNHREELLSRYTAN